MDCDVWRFTSGERPWSLERFRDGVRETTPLPAAIDEASAVLSRHFDIDRAIVARALSLTGVGFGAPCLGIVLPDDCR